MRTSHYLAVGALYAGLCVLIAIVFDSPTSVFLLVGLAVVATGLSYRMSRR
jgi:hypothetical protein